MTSDSEMIPGVHRKRERVEIDVTQLDRLPPHSIEAEQGVLGCILISPVECWEPVAIRLKDVEGFYDLRHQRLFAALAVMVEAGVGIDLVTVQQRLKDDGILEDVGGLAYLSALQDAVPSVANLSYYLEIVHEKWVLRRILAAATSVAAGVWAGQGTVPDLVDRLGSVSSDLADDASPKADRPVKDGIMAAINLIEAHRQGRKKMLGLSTGLNFLDNITSGLQPHQYWVIAARPGGFKTALAMQIADFVSVELREPVGVFSQEMDLETLSLRMLFSRAGQDFQAFRNGFLPTDAPQKLTLAAGAYGSNKELGLAPPVLRVDETPGLYCEDLELKVRRMYREHGCKVFILDYLQLMQGRRAARYRGENMVMQMTDASASILKLKKELPITFIVLAQENTNRERAEKDRKPMLSDLKDSQRPVQDADLVAFLYEPDMKSAVRNLNSKDEVKQEIARAQLAWLESASVMALPAELRGADWEKHLKRINLYVAKQRNGPTGDCQLVVVKPWMRLIDAHVAKEDGMKRAGVQVQKGFGGDW